MDPMWFYDEEPDLEEWQNFRRAAEKLEKQHFQIRVALRDAEVALHSDPLSTELRKKVKELQRELEELNRKAPWIAADYPVEVLLWGAPHG